MRQQPLQPSTSVEFNTPKSLTFDPETPVREAFISDAGSGISLLFRLYYAPLCSHALRYVSSKAIAEDIVSDIFYEFHSEQHFLNVQHSYRAYLFTAVRHRSFDYVRREMQRQTTLEQAAAISINDAQNPDEITQYEELYHDVQKAINDMPLKRRQIYLLNRFEGKKAPEIAVELALSVRTVETHIFQAIKQLRDKLRDKWF